MDQKQKQMVILGVAAVLALGAGGYFFIWRDSGSSNVAAFEEGPAVRRKVENTGTTEKIKRRETTKAPENEATEIVRKEREEEESTEITRKARSRAGERATKKKEVKPAA